MTSVVIMGVAGCGKSSLGAAVSRATGLVLVEGDDHHSADNRDKMARGVPLPCWAHPLRLSRRTSSHA